MKILTWLLVALLTLGPNTAHAATLLFEDWEGTPASIKAYPNEWWDTSCGSSWPSTSNPGLSTEQAYGGTKSMKFHFTGTQYDTPPHGGCFTSKFFTGAQDIWITWMEWMSPGFVTAGGAIGGAGTKGLYFYAHRPGSSNGNGMTIEYFWGSKQNSIAPQGVYDATPQWDTYILYQNVTPYNMPSSKWVCYEARVKLNDPGVANAEYQLYATNMTDGGSTLQLANYTGKRWRGNNTTDPFPSDAVWDQMKVYVQDGMGDIFRDNLYVTTTRQGCSGTPPVSDTTPPPVPSAPTVPSTNLPATYNWSAVVDPGDLAGYNLYRKLEACAGSGSLTPLTQLGNVLTYQDTTIPTTTTAICVKVASRDTTGNVSAQSAGVDETLVPPGSADTFANVNSISSDTTGATIGFLGLAYKIRYWNDLSSPPGSKAEIVGLNGVTSYRHNNVWDVRITFVCYEAQGSDGVWETTRDPNSYGCTGVTPGSTDSSAPATPTGFEAR